MLTRPSVQDSKDEQWRRAMDYLNVVNELNYMTQIVIMLYEDPNKVTARDCPCGQRCATTPDPSPETCSSMCFRTFPQRSAFMLNYTLVLEPKAVKKIRICHLAMGIGQLPGR